MGSRTVGCVVVDDLKSQMEREERVSFEKKGRRRDEEKGKRRDDSLLLIWEA